MDYCQQIFGKNIRSLSYNDVVNYFSTQQEENDTLEFKSFPTMGVYKISLMVYINQ